MQKILIIEDDVFLGDVLMKKLANNGYEAYLARDGAEGMKKIRELMPDLVLLDIILPTMNGYEILEEKAKDEKISKLPVVVISNSGQPVEIDRVLALGVKDYLIKAQFDPEEVLVKVRLQLGDHSHDVVVPKKTDVLSSSIKDKKIMWVEDDIFLSEIIAKKLASQGCKLLHETNGESAIKTVQAEIPDVILLDIMLSGMDGFEILKRIKSIDSVKNIPVIMLSNLGQKADIDKAISLGARRFLIKAIVTLDEIIQEIKNVIEEKDKKEKTVSV